MIDNELSQIIQRAKSVRAKMNELRAGITRRDNEVLILQRDLAKEKGRFRFPEFFFGMLVAVVGMLLWGLPSRAFTTTFNVNHRRLIDE